MIDLLIICPFWSGDKKRLLPLSKIITGLEPHPVQDTHIMLVPRQDCEAHQGALS